MGKFNLIIRNYILYAFCFPVCITISFIFIPFLLKANTSTTGIQPKIRQITVANILFLASKKSFLVSDSTNKPEVVRPQRDGTLVLQAKTGRTIGKNIKYMPEWNAFGWFKAGNFIEWDVKVKKPGKYEVYLEWSISDTEAGKPFIFQTARQELHGYVSKSGSWETFKTEKIGYIILDRGLQTMVFKPNPNFEKDFKGGSLMDFREMKLVPVK